MPQAPLLPTGHAAVDLQHVALLERIRVLELPPGGPRSQARSTEEALAFLVEYSLVHFRDEEALLAAAGYPGLVEHRAAHDRFVGELDQLLGDQQRSGEPLGDRVLMMLQEWLIAHVNGMDQAWASWLVERRSA